MSLDHYGHPYPCAYPHADCECAGSDHHQPFATTATDSATPTTEATMTELLISYTVTTSADPSDVLGAAIDNIPSLTSEVEGYGDLADIPEDEVSVSYPPAAAAAALWEKAARALLAAYAAAEESGSVDWSDLDDAHGIAVLAAKLNS